MDRVDPLGDCPRELGGLAIAPESHKRGLRDVRDRTITVAALDDSEWRWSPMRSGDVLLFHSLTIHRARDNDRLDQIRFSSDFRYQARSGVVHEHSLLPHMRWQTWEELYSDWRADDPLRYYWRGLPLEVDPADPPVGGS